MTKLVNILSLIFMILVGHAYGSREIINANNATIIKIHEGNVKIHAFKPNSYIVSTYIVELPKKLVLFDLQYFVNDAKNYLDYARSINKPIDRIILSHYHVDHWGGAEVFNNVAPIYALRESINELRQVYVNGLPNAFRDKAINLLKYIKRASLGKEIIDGVLFRFERILNAEVPFTLVTTLSRQQVIVTSDLVSNNYHSYVAEVKDFSTWISVLRYFKKNYPYRNVLVGHGDPANASAYDDNIEYLRFVRNVKSKTTNLADYRAAVLAKYPDFPNKVIVDCPFTGLNCRLGKF